MQDMDRRSMLTGGAAMSSLIFPAVATSRTYGPAEGKEVAPGVREVDLGERESLIRI